MLSALIAQTPATDTPWWVGVLVLTGLVIVAASLLARTKARTAARVPRDTWDDHARRAHADLRYLYDEAHEGAAIGSPEARVTVKRLEASSREHLYRLEASAPDSRLRELAIECNEAAQALGDAFGARSKARSAYEDTDPDDAPELRAAREREVRASRALSGGRLRLDSAITSLSRVR